MLSPKQLVVREQEIRKSIQPPPSLLGFNMNIDWTVKTWALERPIMAILYQLIEEQVLPRKALKTFIEGFMKGVAREIVFSNEINLDTIVECGLIGDPRIGGQVGLMANYVTRFFPGWKIHAFRPGTTDDWKKAGVKLPQVNWISLQSVGLLQIPVHLVLEFRKGQVIETESGEIVCPRDNRVILSSEPDRIDNYKLMELVLSVLDHNKLTCLIIAGIHLPWLEKTMRRIVEAVKNENPDSFIHLEASHFEDKENEASWLLPNLDSIGLNEQEAFLLARKMKNDFSSVGEEFRKLVRVISEAHPKLRVHGHTKGMYALKDSCAPVKQEKEMMVSATIALMVAGQFQERAKIDWDQVAKGRFQRVARDSGISFFEVPTIIRPALTVGLGDAISISGLALHLTR